MAILRDRNGIFYDIPERELEKFAVPPKKVKQILKKDPVSAGTVGPPQGPDFRPSTIVINLGPHCGEGEAKGEVRAHSSSGCWRRSCGCWRRSCSGK